MQLYLPLSMTGLPGIKEIKKGKGDIFMQGVITRSCQHVGGEIVQPLVLLKAAQAARGSLRTMSVLQSSRVNEKSTGWMCCTSAAHSHSFFFVTLSEKQTYKGGNGSNCVCVSVCAVCKLCHLCQRLDPVVLCFLCFGSDNQRSLRLQVQLHGKHSPARDNADQL